MGFRRNLSYLLSLLPACMAIWGNLAGGWFTLANLAFSFGVLGLAEILTPANTRNQHSAPRSVFPEIILYLHVVSHTAVLVSFFYGIYSGNLQGIYIVFAALSSGAEAGSGAIIVAHELIHKAKPVNQFFGKYLLVSSGNIYFYVHHLRIHHRFVATQKDAATALKNESLYAFQFRTIAGQISQGWQSEKERLGKLGKSAWNLSNILVQNTLLQLAIMGALLIVISPVALGAYVVYIALANLLLEYVNYIEHYGLMRKEAERVNETHSWNCDKVVSRFFLIELSRHADHHNYASKPYHTLESYKNSPVLPGGYASLILPALIPPLWRALVHPVLKRWENAT